MPFLMMIFYGKMEQEKFFHKQSFFSDTAKIILAALCWTAAVYYLIWSQKYFFGVDAYYHIELAEIMKDHGLVLKGFPWADCSTWKTNYFDKDWLFHVFLIPFLYFGKLTGGKAAILVSVFLICICWGYLLRVLKVRHIFFFLILMFCSSGFGFASRLLMCRAHLLSIAFFALAVICILKRKRLLLMLVAVIYSLTYVAGWQVLPLALIFDFIHVLHSRKIRLKTLMVFPALLGMGLGILINPYFPDNIMGIFVANFIVLKAKWFGLGVSINQGVELNPLAVPRLLTQFLPYFIMLFITWGYLFRDRKTAGDGKIYLGTISAIYFLLMLMSFRFSEYSVAVGVAFIALFWDNWAFKIRKKLKYWFVIWFVIYVCLFYYAVSTFLNAKNMPERYELPYSAITECLVDNLPENRKDNVLNPEQVVFTAGWDDAPMLFYGAPQYKYLVFLDPCFMYAYSLEKYKEWIRITDGRAETPAILIHRKFNADFIFLTSSYKKLAALLAQSPNVKLCAEGSDGEKLYKIEISEKALLREKKLEASYREYLKKRKLKDMN